MLNVSGLRAFAAATVVARGAQVVALVSLARWLDQSQMGAVALLTAIFVGFNSLTNMGLDRYAIYSRVREPQDQTRVLDVIWSLQIIRGVVILLLSVPAYLAVKEWTNFDLGTEYFVGIAVCIFMHGAANPHVHIFERNGNYELISGIRTAAALAGALGTCAYVLMWPTPWAYVAGQLSNTFCFALLTFVIPQQRPRFRLDATVAREVMGYSKHLLVLSAVSYLAVQFETFYIAAAYGPTVLGQYFTWNRLVFLPREIIVQLHNDFLFSRVCEGNRRDLHLNNLYLAGFAAIMGLIIPYTCFVILHGDALVEVVFGTHWVDTWWVGKMLAVVSLLYAVSGTVGPFLIATSPWISSTLRTIETILLICLTIWFGTYHGLQGVIAASITSIGLASLSRLLILCARVIRADRIRLAVFCIAVVVVSAIPVIALEFTLLQGSHNSFLCLFGYGLTYTMLASLLFAFRRSIGRQLLAIPN